jgi:hypothetical protein
MTDANAYRKYPQALLCLILLISPPLMAREMTEAEKLKWLNSDEPVKKQRPINEGDLTFLDRKKFRDVMHSDNRITITHSSLKDGWVNLDQCYRNLDAFPKVEVVYKYRKMRNLKIQTYKGIKSAMVAGQSVQLEQVKKGATLCVKAQVQSLFKRKSGRFSLKNGPYRRRFLDGYFPMQVTVAVTYPKKMRIKNISPNKKGMQITRNKNRVILNAIFEGILNTQIDWEV